MAFGRPTGDEARCADEGVDGAGGRGAADGLPVGVVEAGLAPAGPVGGGVNGGIANGELPGAVERDDGLAQGDVQAMPSEALDANGG